MPDGTLHPRLAVEGDLFRATIVVDVVFEADGPGHAIAYATRSIVDRIATVARGDNASGCVMPELGREHISAKARLVQVLILSTNGEAVIPDA